MNWPSGRRKRGPYETVKHYFITVITNITTLLNYFLSSWFFQAFDDGE